MARMGLIGALLALPMILGGTSPLATPAEAQQTSVNARQCPIRTALPGLCRSLDDQRRITLPDGRTQYEFVLKVQQAACADPAIHPPEEIRRRVQEMWRTSERELSCRNAGFDVPDGMAGKQAIRSRAFTFLEYMVEDWQVDLNQIDRADGRTLLDYAKAELAANEPGENEITPQLQEWHDYLRSAGAKYCDELPDTSQCGVDRRSD